MSANATSDRLVGTIELPGGAWGIAYDRRNGEVYAAQGYGANRVAVIDARNDTATGSIEVGKLPQGVTADPANGRVYVVNSGSDNVSVINDSTNRILATIGVGAGPLYSTLDPANGELFVTNSGADTVSIINTSTDQVVDTAPVGIQPAGLVYDPANGDVYIVDDTPTYGNSSGSVTVLNGSTGAYVTTISVGVCPWGTAYDSTTKEVYVVDTTCTSDGDVSVINATTNLVTATIRFGWATYPDAIVYDPANGFLFASNYLAANVSIIDAATNRVVGTIGAGELPTAEVYDPRNGLVYVADSGGNEISEVNGSTGGEAGSFGSWYGPDGLALDLANGNLYVANYFSNNVSVINSTTNRPVASIRVGNYPQGVGYDPANGDLYVANCDSDNVSIIDGASDRLIGSVVAGVCPRSVLYDPPTGRIYVTNFGPQSATEFVDENITVIDGTTNRVSGSLDAGGSPWGIAYDSDNGLVYVANSYSDNLTVINASTDAVVASLALGAPWTGDDPTALVYDPRDQELFVTFYNPGFLVMAVRPSTSQILGTVDAGFVPEAVLFDAQTSNLFVANNGCGSVSVLKPTSFPPARFSVSFNETGLASDGRWSVTLNNTTTSSTLAAIAFSEIAGKYTYSIAAEPGYLLLSPSNGSVDVDQRNITVLLRFAALYSVTFTEFGLPGGSSWTIVWNGSTIGVSRASLTLSATNGRYSFSVPPTGDFLPSPASGNLTLSGSNQTESILFEGPGPSLDSFAVTPVKAAVGTTFVISADILGGVAPLAYGYTGLPPNCVSEDAPMLSCTPSGPGNFTVEVVVTDSLARNLTANASFQVTKTPVTQPRGTPESPKFLGLPWEQGAALLVAVSALVVGGAVRLLWRKRARAPPRSGGRPPPERRQSRS